MLEVVVNKTSSTDIEDAEGRRQTWRVAFNWWISKIAACIQRVGRLFDNSCT